MKQLEIVIIGGSVGGLYAAIALRAKGLDVRVYERAAGDMESRGAGLGLPDDMYQYLISSGTINPELSGVVADSRQILSRSGEVIDSSRGGNLPSTSWDYLWQKLKAQFPDDLYFFGHEVERVEQSGEKGKVIFTNGKIIKADLVIGADGYNSLIRQSIVSPATEPEYAGYVAYRGVVSESQLTPDARTFFKNKFTTYPYAHSHIVSYFIPGTEGELTEGERRFNWVWYVNLNNEELNNLLTDKNGIRRKFAIASGYMSKESLALLQKRATNELPAIFSEQVIKTINPFVQSIIDLTVPRMYLKNFAIIGDAAFVVRPHTASGTAKAFRDAFALAAFLERSKGNLQEALQSWNSLQLDRGLELFEHGLSLGKSNGLGFLAPITRP